MYMYKKNNPDDNRRIDKHEPEFNNKEDTMVLDDISISGGSFISNCSSFMRYLGFDNFSQKDFYFFPIVLSPYEKNLFSNVKILYLNKTPPTDNVFSKNNKNTSFSVISEIFNEDELFLLRTYLTKGYNNGINAVVFPYIIPDNSSEFIGILFDKFLYKSTINSNKMRQALLFS